MKYKTKGIAIALTTALVLTGVGGNPADAAKKAKISKSKLSLQVGQSKQLSVKNLTKKQKKKLKWSSGKKKIATVSKKGKVTAKKVGKAKITAKVGKKKYTCKVTVTKKTDSEKISTSTPVPKTKEQLAAEDRANLEALIKKQNANGIHLSEKFDDDRYCYQWNEDGRLVYLRMADDETGDWGVSRNIDVSCFTALESLYLDNNSKVTGINTKGITTLKTLCFDYTAVTSIDVSTNVNLKMLSFTKSPVSSLDISKNTKLTQLWISNSKVSKLNVSKNTALERLVCSGLNVTSLDVSQNTALTYLCCYGNKFTSLNVSNLGASNEVEIICDEDVTVTGANSKVTIRRRS